MDTDPIKQDLKKYIKEKIDSYGINKIESDMQKGPIYVPSMDMRRKENVPIRIKNETTGKLTISLHPIPKEIYLRGNVLYDTCHLRTLLHSYISIQGPENRLYLQLHKILTGVDARIPYKTMQEEEMYLTQMSKNWVYDYYELIEFEFSKYKIYLKLVPNDSAKKVSQESRTRDTTRMTWEVSRYLELKQRDNNQTNNNEPDNTQDLLLVIWYITTEGSPMQSSKVDINYLSDFKNWDFEISSYNDANIRLVMSEMENLIELLSLGKKPDILDKNSEECSGPPNCAFFNLCHTESGMQMLNSKLEDFR